MTEITNQLICHRSCAICQKIFHVARIHHILQLTLQQSPMILLFCRLSLPIEQYYIMGLTLKKILTILFQRITTVTTILDNIHTMMKQNERIGIRMSMIPCIATLHRQHRGILLPRITHSSPSKGFPQMRSWEQRSSNIILIDCIKESYWIITVKLFFIGSILHHACIPTKIIYRIAQIVCQRHVSQACNIRTTISKVHTS